MKSYARVKGQSLNLRMRVVIVCIVLGLCSVSLIGRATYIQLINNGFYQRQGQARYLRDLPIATTRGTIADRNNEPLAVSTPVISIWANPQEVLDHPEQLARLSQSLKMAEADLKARLTEKSHKEFVYLKRRINPDLGQRLIDQHFQGLYVQQEFRRFYPQGETLAHVLGFTNIDDHGQEGFELAFDRVLRGQPGSQRVVRDAGGKIVENVNLIRSAVAGRDMTITIDRRVQYLAYEQLQKGLIENQASGGSAVVMDVNTGEILAMVNLPSYNPNALTDSLVAVRRNRAVTDLVEPGSTMKPLTIAAALSAGVIQKDTLIDTNPGYITLGRYTIHDVPRNNGVLDVTGVITHSSNVGAAKIVAKISDQFFYNTIRLFGYGRVPGSLFPGEAAGVVPTPAHWSATSKSTMSYGYGLSVSPLQIARAYAALGNGGKLVTPTFLKDQCQVSQQIISTKIADDIVKMMETVVTDGGAKQASILGYRVAGKTGTARKIGPHGYERNHYNSLFVGLVPASKPRYVAVIEIEDPQARFYYGGLVAAPVFQHIMAGTLRLMNVPMDDLATLLASVKQHPNHRSQAVSTIAAPGQVTTRIDEITAHLPRVGPAETIKSSQEIQQ